MKKIALLVLPLFFNSTYSQTTMSDSIPIITDTIGYLRDSIGVNKAFYIGKPLHTLLTNLKLQVRSYTGPLPLPSEPDTIIICRFTLEFSTTDKLFSKLVNQQKMPCIEVRFATPIPIPKIYFTKGRILDATTEWTQQKISFYGPHVIADLRVMGL